MPALRTFIIGFAVSLTVLTVDRLAIAERSVDGARSSSAEYEGTENVESSRTRYDIPRRLCSLRNVEIDESSGLAVSKRRDGVYWTHNDSGGAAVLYAFDAQGRDLGTWRIRGAANRDWEDMASVVIDGRPILIAGEVGDNFERWGTYRLYFVEEPDIPVESGDVDSDSNRTLDPLYVMSFRYEDGSHNCEAIAVDPTGREILLITKTTDNDSEAGVYRLKFPDVSPDTSVDVLPDTSPTQTVAAPPLPPLVVDDSLRLDSGPKVEIARRIATLSLPKVTAMDISPSGRLAVVLTYTDAYQYHRGDGESWSEAFARPPRILVMPIRRQGESIGFGRDGKSLYLTSEKRPTPLWYLPPVEASQ